MASSCQKFSEIREWTFIANYSSSLSTQPVSIRDVLTTFIGNQYFSQMYIIFLAYSLLGLTEEGRKIFLLGVERKGSYSVILPLKVLDCYKRLKQFSLFVCVKFEIIRLLLCSFLNPLTNNSTPPLLFLKSTY